MPATVVSAHSAGPMARVSLTKDGSGDHVEVVLSRDRLVELALHSGDRVFLVPQRVKVFAGDE
jgi:ABC-type sulfate/molybdate transport systems ATPase subunit